MPKKHSSPQQLLHAQMKRFEAVQGDAAKGMEMLKEEALEELSKLVDGSKGVKGKARRKALRAAGHPYARNDSPQDKGDFRFGSKRGVVKEEGISAGIFPQLPIGVIDGKLESSVFAEVDGYTLTLGFNDEAEESINAVLPLGTRKVVSRGVMLPNEGGAMGKIMKRARRAFAMTFFDELKAP